jgi:hypothetical protein
MSGCMKTSTVGTAARPRTKAVVRARPPPLPPPLADSPTSLREQAGEEQGQEQLPELGRLEAEEAKVDPASGAADVGAEHHHDQQHRDHQGVDHLSVTAVVVGIDQQRSHKPHQSDKGEDRLAEDVILGVAGDVQTGNPADRPEAEGDEPGHRGEHHPVDAPDE